MVKLSILMAYYKTYNLTLKLLKELAIQKTNEVEVIVIDDGCQEKTFDTFNDFKIIHLEENQGMSNALNIGLKQAKGKYIGFIDSDDMITMDYIDILLNTINNHNEDIIYFNWADFNNNLIVRHPKNFALWKAIYKRDIFPGFEKNRRANNDVPVQEKLRSKHHTEYYIDRVLYIYNSNRVGSITWIIGGKKMIKVEVTEEFTYGDFYKIKDTLIRKSKAKEGYLYVGDIFECDEETLKYLMGDNKLKKAFVKVIEVIQEANIEEAEEKKPSVKSTKKTTRKKKK